MTHVSTTTTDRSSVSVAGSVFFIASVSLLFLAACSSTAQQRDANVTSLQAEVAAFPGEFVWREDLQRYLLTNADKFYESLDQYSEELVLRDLFDCMDRVSPSKTSIDGRPVPVGVMCHRGMTYYIVHEPIDETGDIAENWPGYFPPTAGPAELSRAKSVWQAVLDSGDYQHL